MALVETEARSHVVIVGGGVSGTLVAIRLLSTQTPPTQITIIEPREELGQGIAYSTDSEVHLLNVRAQGMTLFPEQPDHFVEWLADHRGRHPDDVRKTFAQRREFARYVMDTLEAAKAGDVNFRHLKGTASDVKRADAGYLVSTSAGEVLLASDVVLALGNQTPRPPSFLRNLENTDHLIPNPWDMKSLRAIQAADRVLLVGAGLTMLDVVMYLRAHGHSTPIQAVSRHGLNPTVHSEAKPGEPLNLTEPSALGAMRQLVRTCRDHETNGGDWRSIVDSVRPFTQKIWSAMPHDEKRRIVRHLQTYWDIHRHRVAPEIASVIDELRSTGALTLLGGRVVDTTPTAQGVLVTIKPRHGEAQTLTVDKVVNCTGPNPDWRIVANPLIESLVRQGLANYDDLGFGVKIGSGHEVLNSQGTPTEGLFAIGPLCRGALWETTAVPEIRVQAKAVSAELEARVAPMA